MSFVLLIYTTKAYRKYMLPIVNNTNYSIVLRKEIFYLPEDLEINLEVIDGKWFFPESDSYNIQHSITKEGCFGREIQNEDLLSVTLPHSETLNILISRTDSSFHVFRKYDIRANSFVTIGKNESNDIQYNALNLVSREHAIIRRDGDGFILEDISTNGIYVNDVRMKEPKRLEFGDCIEIYGLCIVYLNGIIAVNTSDSSVKVHEEKLHEYTQPNTANPAPAENAAKKEKLLYHRSPRQIYKMHDEVIDIEAPPQPKPQNKKPLSMIIGPSLTMSLPMIFGCLLTVFSSRMNGSKSGIFMYTGIITAVSSALIGITWTLVNIRYEKRKNEEEELHRFDAYHKYLVDTANDIKEKYEKNTAYLRKMYLSPEECSAYDETNQLLWNRNKDHKDFLSHRIGTGDMPFQVTINIPKERFSLMIDSLAEKPSVIRESYKNLHQVPICVDLLEHRLLGIIGGEDKRGAIDVMHNLAAQIAVSNCYTDVKMAFVYDERTDGSEDWGYLRWFPHVWSEDKKTRFVAGNRTEAGEVIYEITKVLRTRMEEKGYYAGKNMMYKPHYVLFVSNPELLDSELITKYLFDSEENYGITAVFLADSYDSLPNACDYIIQNDDRFQGMYGIADDVEERVSVKFDFVHNIQLERLARTLSDVEVRESETGREIPESLTFFDMLGIRNMNELHVLEHWKKNRTYESMRAVVGQKAGGMPMYLDVHEKYHGPHGLVAGTTGSGKSETLQTYILSLAIHYSPDDVAFLLIDYKGGGMANLFAGLPHMIGQISNLSGNQVKRAMVAIKSENKRRERIFNEYGVKNINLYTRLYKNNEASVPVPHLFIVIDEFAELKREEPDFMRELISVAQVGRSLGVHLILATQKPGGIVDDNIRSNARFRLCLRVQDRQDSADMIHRPDAAYITQAGRCYMQVGNDELFELFQSGWSGAVYDENSGSIKEDIAYMVSDTGKAALVGNKTKLKQKEAANRQWIKDLISAVNAVRAADFGNPALTDSYIQQIFTQMQQQKIDYPYSEYNALRIKNFLTAYSQTELLSAEADEDKKAQQILDYAQAHRLKLPEKKEKTQLDAVVEYLGDIAESNGYHHQFQLWLPVLPTTLYLSQLPEYEEYFDGNQWKKPELKEWNLEVPLGLYDDPVNQLQDTLKVSLSKNGHYAVVGTIVSGKSTLLQTLLYAFVTKYTPQDINIYAIDYSAKMMSAFETMPHVGGVIYEGQDDKLAKFFTMINDILEDRKKLFKGGNYGQYVRVNGVTVPAVIIVIDNYANFRVKSSNIYDDTILQLSKDGVSYGIFLIISGGGFSTMEIPTRLGENLRSVICLEMNDKLQYQDAMHTLHIDTLPEVNIKGRGLAKAGDEILEFQTALAFEAADDFKRIAQIEKLGRRMKEVWTGKCARVIPEIPEKPIWSEFAGLEDTSKLMQDDRHLPIGYNAQNASVYGIDLSRTYCYLITGRARSGKTNLLKVIINSAMQKGGEAVVFDFKSEFAHLSEREGVAYVATKADLFAFFQNLIPEFVARNKRKKGDIQENLSDEEIYADMKSFPAKYFFIPDLGSFIQNVRNPENSQDAKPFIENLLDKGSMHNVYWFAVLQPDDMTGLAGTRIYDLFVRYKTGMHFGGNVSSQRIFNFDYIPYNEQTKAVKAGIGLVPYHEDETVHKVVIPLVKGFALEDGGEKS
ncbi:MAG: type VII secretion protein EssC [Lachnospiraceae bacterium]|nr:type VII secretion protein EssC [Lachnospiraceae bacterium]